MAVRVAVELNLFNYVAENAKDGRSITADELARRSGAEQLLVGKRSIYSPSQNLVFFFSSSLQHGNRQYGEILSELSERSCNMYQSA